MPRAKPICSWDQVPWKEHTIFTQGNVNEVLPGVTHPLYADLAAWWDYYWVAGVVDDLGVRGQVHVEPPPCFNQLGFMGGRWTVNVSINLTLSATWALPGGSSMLQAFFEGGDAIVSQAGEGNASAGAARSIISERWRDAAKNCRASDRVSRASYQAARKRRMHLASDQQIVDLIEENTKLVGRLFVYHYYVTVGGGEYASLLGGLLDQYFKKRPPEWVTMLTSGLGAVESARPGHALWDLSRLIAARPSLATAFRELSNEEVLVRTPIALSSPSSAGVASAKATLRPPPGMSTPPSSSAPSAPTSKLPNPPTPISAKPGPPRPANGSNAESSRRSRRRSSQASRSSSPSPRCSPANVRA
jgi:hypothetical protein